MTEFEYDTIDGKTITIEIFPDGSWSSSISKKKLDSYDLEKIREEIEFQMNSQDFEEYD